MAFIQYKNRVNKNHLSDVGLRLLYSIGSSSPKRVLLGPSWLGNGMYTFMISTLMALLYWLNEFYTLSFLFRGGGNCFGERMSPVPEMAALQSSVIIVKADVIV